MDLGECYGQAITLPSLANHRSGSSYALCKHPNGLDIGVSLPAVAALSMLGVTLQAFIEKALAGYVVIDADNGWRTSVSGEPVQLRLFDAGVLGQVSP